MIWSRRRDPFDQAKKIQSQDLFIAASTALSEVTIGRATNP